MIKSVSQVNQKVDDLNTEESVRITEGVMKEAEDYVASLVFKFGKETTMRLITDSSIDMGNDTKR